MKQTGDYWLLAVTNPWDGQPNYIMFNYSNNSCSYWSTSLDMDTTLEVLDKPIPHMSELVEHYARNLLFMLPLESPTSIQTQYPELLL